MNSKVFKAATLGLTTKSLLLASAVSIFGATVATAQTAPAPASAGNSSTTVETVVVTAEKKSESLQNVPMSVAVVSADSLVQQNLFQLSDIATRIPGLNYFGDQQSDLAIRGITTGGGTNPTVAVTIDDVAVGSSSYAGQSLTPDLDPAILNQIEVLRGPQGTLYGANSLGGLIRYVTKDPDPNNFWGKVEADGETVDGGNDGGGLRGSMNVPVLTDQVGLLVSGFLRDDPAYIDDVYPGVDKKDSNANHAYGGRAALLIAPTSHLTINLSTLVQRKATVGTGDEYLNSNYQPQTGDLQQSSLLGNYHSYDLINSARVNYDFGFANLTSVTGYSVIKDNSVQDVTQQFQSLIPILDYYTGFTASPTDRVLINQAHSNKKVSEELRLASEGPTNLEWMIGAFYTREQTSTAQIVNAEDTAGPLNIASIVAPSTYWEAAIFANATYHFTDQFDIQVGDRFAGNKQAFSDDTSGPLDILEDGVPSYDIPTGHSHEDSDTWLISPRYHFTDDLMGYIRIASGYRPGGPNIDLPSVTNKTFQSDSVINYEAGVKGTALGGSLTYDGDVFYIDWSRIQLSETDPVSESEFFGNGSSARSFGLEGSATYRPWDGMTIDADAAYTNAELTASLPIGPSSDIYAKSGQALPFSPKFSGNLSAQQNWVLVDDWSAYAGGTLSYMSQRYGVFPESSSVTRISLPGFTQLDLRAGVEDDTWSLGLFIRNINNARGFLYGQLLNPASAAEGYEVTPIRPRTFGISVSKSF